MKLHRDYETRSTVDLKKTGSHVYMRHPTTDIWCCRYAVDDGPVKIWLPGMPVPQEFFDAAEDPEAEVWAHNCAFEQDVERHIAGPRYGFPVFSIEKQRCTMVTGYALSLPGSLEMAAPAVGIKEGKDTIGGRLMLQLAKPRGKIEFVAFNETPNWSGSIPFNAVRIQEIDDTGTEVYQWKSYGDVWQARVRWWNDPEKLQRLYDYCGQDTVVEREYEKRLRKLKPSELELWHLDQTINQRGVFIDQPLAEAAKKIVEAAEDDLDARMNRLTKGEVSGCSNRNQMLAFVRKHGLDIDSLNKATLEDVYDDGILARIADFEREAAESDDPEKLEWLWSLKGSTEERAKLVEGALDLWRMAARASVAKIETLLRGADPDDLRVRGLLQFNAATTGRWGGRRFQPQNLKRPEESDIDTLIEIVRAGDYETLAMLYDDPLSAVSDILRGLICAAPGKKIVAADYSNIEGRVLAWLAGENWKIQAFRDFDAGKGHDLYALAYARSYGITPEEVIHNKKHGDGSMRQIGKVMELALGYQGGVGAFNTMGANYGVNLPKEQVEGIRDAWRQAHPSVKQFWYDMEAAAIAAVEEPGSTQIVANGKIVFRKAGSFLFMRLPSKRLLAYPYPKVMPVKTKWLDDDGQPIYKDALTYFSTIDMSKKAKVVPDPGNSSTWARISTYGGMLAENATQAASRDILADAMPRLEAAGYPVILTVHDEVVAEPDEGHGSVEEFEKIMTTLPDWAAGLPVAVEGFCDVRYRK